MFDFFIFLSWQSIKDGTPPTRAEAYIKTHKKKKKKRMEVIQTT
jgi:hypothetical protein